MLVFDSLCGSIGVGLSGTCCAVVSAIRDVGVAVGVRAGFCTLVFTCICNFGVAVGVIRGVAGRL